MPGIYFLRRRWAIGSDDFVFPSFVELCLRVSWLLTISVLLAVHRGSFTCEHGYLLRTYYVGTLVILSVGILHTLATMGVSMRGSIRDGRARRHINVLLYLKAAILLPEAVWLMVATYWAFGFSFSCDWTVYWTARGAVICAWVVGFWMFVGLLLVFDPLGSADSRVSMGDTLSKRGTEYLISSSKAKNMRVWETRCRCLCCCISNSQDTDAAFSDVSKLVADYFKDIDLVPTDIAAGLVLVAQHQESIESHLSAIIVDSVRSGQSAAGSTAALSTNGGGGEPVMLDGGAGPKSWMTIPTMTHYMKFALGSYGWPFFMYTNLFTGLCRLGAMCRCCSCMRSQNDVYSDNVCECHTAAIKQLTKIRDQDLIHVSFHNKYREIPFYVALDRKFNNVVVSIRGTLSLQDALTDLSAKGVALEIEGVPDATCHDAMLACATYIQSQLQDKRLLERAFAALQDDAGLVIVGHSLGAGVAAILAVLLRPHHPSLACFAYSPPGGLMSPSASSYARDFVCSVVVGEDIIPRLGMPSMCQLKVKVLRALCQSNSAKYKILATGCLRMLCSCLQSPDSQASLDAGGESAYLTESRQRRYSTGASQLQPNGNHFLEDALKAAEDYEKEMLEMDWPMHPPGQILHIVEQEESSLCGGGPQYTALWARPQDFSSILISHKMVLDHFPDVVLRSLSQLEERNFVPRAHRVALGSNNDC